MSLGGPPSQLAASVALRVDEQSIQSPVLSIHSAADAADGCPFSSLKRDVEESGQHCCTPRVDPRLADLSKPCFITLA
jgi:hypothetical protein